MPECEFKKFCQYVNDEFNCDDPDDYFGCEYSIMMSKVQEETCMLFVGYIDKDSPQFKKQYAKLPEDGKNPYHDHAKGCSDGDACEFCAYEIGRYQPDPKQYAKREELVEAIRQKFNEFEEAGAGMPRFYAVSRIIRTHGLEE